MADLASALLKMTDVDVAADAPLSQSFFEKMGANINGLIDRNLVIADFTSSGTWACPANVTTVLLIGWGGGGGGSFNLSGNPGGDGAPLGVRVSGVTPLTNYSVTIGSGGGGATIGGSGGGGGGTTSIGSINFFGGRGTNDFSVENIGTGAVGGQTGFTRGGRSSQFMGGTAGSSACGGGAGPGGAGGNAPGGSGAANSGAGGAGTPTVGPAGSGGSGRLYIVYRS